MVIRVVEGGGIFGGVYDSDEIDRRIAEDQRKEAAAAQLAAEQAEYAAELEATLDRIEKAITVYVADELQAEFAAQRQAEEKRKRAHLGAFLRFKEYCGRYETPLPHLPAAPAAIAAFLTSEMEKGQAHLNRLCAAIAVMHKRVDLPDPTNDPLVRAVIRLAHKDKSSPPTVNPS
jgi:hypothetical protein